MALSLQPRKGNLKIIDNKHNMKLFFTKKELHLRKKRIIAMVACLVVLLAMYLILTWPKEVVPEPPLVSVEPEGGEDVEIYGE